MIVESTKNIEKSLASLHDAIFIEGDATNSDTLLKPALRKPSGDTNENGSLETDETWLFTATYYLTEEDGEYVTNSATAYGTDLLGHTVTAWDDLSILNPYYYDYVIGY